MRAVFLFLGFEFDSRYALFEQPFGVRVRVLILGLRLEQLLLQRSHFSLQLCDLVTHLVSYDGRCFVQHLFYLGQIRRLRHLPHRLLRRKQIRSERTDTTDGGEVLRGDEKAAEVGVALVTLKFLL